MSVLLESEIRGVSEDQGVENEGGESNRAKGEVLEVR